MFSGRRRAPVRPPHHRRVAKTSISLTCRPTKLLCLCDHNNSLSPSRLRVQSQRGFWGLFADICGCLRAAEEDVVGGAKAEFSWREAPLLAGASQWPLCVPASTTSSAVKRGSFSPQPGSAASGTSCVMKSEPRREDLMQRSPELAQP